MKNAHLSEGRASSKYAQEGTDAHEVAAKWLKTRLSPTLDDLTTLEHIRTYVDFVLEQWEPGNVLRVEERFRLTDIEDDIPMFGTADAVVYQPKRKHLHIVDFKFGIGVPVEAENNIQLLYYALGVWYRMGRKGVRTLTLTIVQPRAFHTAGPVRSWGITIADLSVFEGDLIEAVERVRRNPNLYVPGDHCRWCAAAGRCKPFAVYALKEIYMNDPNLMTPEQLVRALRKSQDVKSWIKAVEEEGAARAEAGKVPPGMKLVAGRKTRVWTDEEEALDRISHLFPDLDVVDVKLKSPAQIEGMIGHEQMGELNDLIEHTTGKPVLADISDPRPGIGSNIDHAMKGL